VRDIAAIVQRLVPGTGIVYTGEVGKDPRDYRIDFAKLGRLLPDFRLEYTLAAGMEELLARFRASASRRAISTATGSSGCARCAIASTG
jgi:hypothetical protein